VLALVKQIQGKLKIVPSENGSGTKFAVTFLTTNWDFHQIPLAGDESRG
jgi:hypothetical protein